MPTPLSNRSTLSEVGRVGRLDLLYRRRGIQTILARSRCSSPWHLFPPMYLDDSGCAFTSLVNPSGGFVAGDHLSIHASLEQDAHIVISTPSANRVYRSLSGNSRQTVKLSADSGAIIEWFPEVTIPFAGSRFAQTIDVTLAEGATALIWDSVASGRVARGERWTFASLQSDIRITTASGDQLIERYEVMPERGGAGLLSDYDYVASLFVVSDAIDPAKWGPLREVAADVLDSMGAEVLGGVTEPPIPGLAIKLVARSAESLAVLQELLWDEIRADVIGLKRPELRRY
ncbi:MAG: putative Urease accessory protein UreD [Nitrospira sp.]|jgi:urease accessory protein|nr:putative Urease accessory protein UreD [Nitrospira sp.]